jgi:hypothetical protein
VLHEALGDDRRHPIRSTGCNAQVGLSAGERLKLALYLERQDDGERRRNEIEPPTTSCKFFYELEPLKSLNWRVRCGWRPMIFLPMSNPHEPPLSQVFADWLSGRRRQGVVDRLATPSPRQA